MLNRLPGIGLDIGSKQMRMIRAVPRKSDLEIIRFGSLPTPPGTVEGGNIIDPVRLGEELRLLVRKLQFRGKRVVCAVSGPQLYIRNLIMPRLKMNELREAVYYQSTNFLPIPVEEAAIAICPLRDIEDQNAKKTEVFFLAVRRQQVENLEVVCRTAGLKLAAVEIEPLSLFRVWGQGGGKCVGLLSVGSEHSYFTVLKRGIPVFYRSLASGGAGSYCNPLHNHINRLKRWEEVLKLNDPPFNPRTAEITDEVKNALEYYQVQMGSQEQNMEKILLYDGGAIRGLKDILVQELNLKVEGVNVLQNSILPNHISRQEKYELQYDFPLALGLAARKVV